MNENKLVGRWGERMAADYLRAKGYNVLQMGYTTRGGEIDIVAEDHGVIAFVEVKLRSDVSFARAADAVTLRKQRRIISAARYWITENDADVETRFDVIEIYAPEGAETESPVIEHTEGAFWES